MKIILPFAFIFLSACNKELTKPQPKTNGIVEYAIEGDSIQIIDSASSSVANGYTRLLHQKGMHCRLIMQNPEVMFNT